MKLETFFEKFDQFADAPDAVAKMRELVLQLAVQGTIVDSVNNDEPVDDFLQRIWTDKSGSRTELLDVEKAQPFELPAHWRWVVLAEVAEFSIGKTPPRGDSSYWYPEDHSWVSIADMKNYGTITETKEKVSSSAAQDVFRQRFAEPGSILMSFKLTIGKVARAGIRCFHNEAIISLQPPEPELADYLFRFLPIFAKLQTSNNAIKGSTLNKGLLILLPIALPPLPEQRRIVAKVDELMALCDRLALQQQERETRHAALARASLARFADAPTPANLPFLFHPSYAIPPADLRKSILTLAVQGKLVPQDPNDEPAETLRDAPRKAEGKKAKWAGQIEEQEQPFQLPPSWKWFRLGDVSSLKHGYAFSSNFFTSEPAPFVLTTPGNFHEKGGFRDRESKRKYYSGPVDPEFVFQTGDLIIPMTEQAAGLLGSPAFIPDDGRVYIHNQRLGKLTFVDSIAPEFAFWFFNCDFFRGELARTCTGMKVRHTSPDRVLKVPFPLPPLAEQRRIVAKVEQLMALVDALETQLAASRATAANLLSALVAELTGTPNNGKVSVPSVSTTGRRGRPPKS